MTSPYFTSIQNKVVVNNFIFAISKLTQLAKEKAPRTAPMAIKFQSRSQVARKITVQAALSVGGVRRDHRARSTARAELLTYFISEDR